MRISYPHLATRIFNVPIAIAPRKAEIIVASLADRLGVASISRKPMAMEDDDYGYGNPDPDGYGPGYDVIASVAQIEIKGTLVQKNGCLRPYSGMTGYDGVRQNFVEALADPAVRAIVLDIDSPGGEVSGCFDLVDTISAARGIKPVWAILSEYAFSAAYAIASAADRITVPRTGGTGSVGVIMMHADLSRALDGAGIAVTLITFGDRKAEGNEFQPLSVPALAAFQADIDAMGELFVDTVARNRGLSANAVRATEAACFLGAAGVAVGFADAVAAPDAAFRELVQSLV